MAYKNIQEKSVEKKVAADWFGKFDCTETVGRIDFGVKTKGSEDDYVYWAEAKQKPTDIYQMLAQLILTIKADAENHIPPKFIGCFDCEKIAFIEYHHTLDIHNLNDFDWSQTPSLVNDKTVKAVRNTLPHDKIYCFYFDKDADNIKDFIKNNLTGGGSLLSTPIDKNNFVFVFQKWRQMVMPYIDVDWEKLKKGLGFYERDLFLAELNIDDNNTTNIDDDRIANRQFHVTFNVNSEKPYQMFRKIGGFDNQIIFGFKKDGLKRYSDFWKRYKRPPQNEYWNYIVSRQDLLVPQDVRERKGAFYTPLIWVEKSQQYIADVLGENWQEEYYIWDCCAGTGNMEVGLKEAYNVWASTIDQQDVDVMRENIRNDTAKMLDSHVFQFDFLNDNFDSDKVPNDLKKVLFDPEKRKKLVIYINPPYAEGDNRIGEGRKGVANSRIKEKYGNFMGYGKREIFLHFITRIYTEIPDCMLCFFSTLVHMQGSKFYEIRNNFKASLKKLFIVPASTFDNVSGDFPIGFQIWNCQEKEPIKTSIADVYDKKGNNNGQKTFFAYDNCKYINDWTLEFIERDKKFEEANSIANIIGVSNDFQNQSSVCIENPNKPWNHKYQWQITKNNLIESCIYFSVRKCIKHIWKNHYDQFLYPIDEWKTDYEFQTNCLIWTLFSDKNFINANARINHWIPFKESEVGAKERFDSHFMSDFLAGKIKAEQPKDLFSDVETANVPTLRFSTESQAVMNAGRELWRYYHTMADANPNASLYDIKEYFQGRDAKGKMKAKSDDKQYTELLENLKAAMQALAEQIRPKVYEYGFLK